MAAEEVLAVLTPIEIAPDATHATFPSVWVADGRVYGGQYVGQATIAAGASVGRDRTVVSLQGQFLRGGDIEEPVEYVVEPIRDGRSFSTRRVSATQSGATLFTAMITFQAPAEGPTHAEPGPAGVPDPEDCPIRPLSAPETAGLVSVEGMLESREVPADRLGDGSGRLSATWVKVRDRLPDDPSVHRAALGYISDAFVQDALLARHGVGWFTPGIELASLDHSVWWYDDARADEWVLVVQEAPVAARGRGLTLGRIYAFDGRLIAAVAQDVLIRSTS
jgi:acyl-CoA thioesterase II